MHSRRNFSLAILYVSAVSVLLAAGLSTRGQDSQITYMHRFLKTSDPHLDANTTVGFRTCANCHKSEFGVWQSTWHHTSFQTLHRSQEAKAIASRLELSSVKYSQRCIRCHYTETQTAGQLSVDAAVSCESCHGAGLRWYSNHFPIGQTSFTESLVDKDTRVSRNIGNGMRNRHNTYTMARICMRCHNVDDEELVNVGQHGMGSLDFEMVAWSQGRMRHRFVSGRGERNMPNAPDRLALMFVSGIIADLEFSLRATAKATQKAEYGVQAARRCSKAAKKLQQVQTLVQLPILQTVLDEYRTIRLKSNNANELNRAADNIQVFGVRFAAETDASLLRALKDYIPKEPDWVWE